MSLVCQRSANLWYGSLLSTIATRFVIIGSAEALPIIGSAEALPILCVRYIRWERERDTEKDGSDVTIVALIGDEFTLSLAKNSHNWRRAYTFPCQKFALFVSPFTLPVSSFTERSPLWRWKSQWVHTFHCQNFLRPLCSPSFKWREPRDEWSKTQDKWSNPAQSYYRKRGSASYIVREVLSVRESERERDTDRERERERERRKWRHHCHAKIGDEFTLSLAKNSHNWRWAYTFPCQNFALFVSPFTLPVSPFTERSPWWRWNSQWVHTSHCQNFFRPQALFPLFQMARAARGVIENPRQMIKSCPVLFSSHRKNESN